MKFACLTDSAISGPIPSPGKRVARIRFVCDEDEAAEENERDRRGFTIALPDRFPIDLPSWRREAIGDRKPKNSKGKEIKEESRSTGTRRKKGSRKYPTLQYFRSIISDVMVTALHIWIFFFLKKNYIFGLPFYFERREIRNIY